MARILLVLPLALFAAVAEASSEAALNEKDVQTPLHPNLQPESSKKFFSKDYPHDVDAGRNGLHFKHPYPAVQDTEEFDTDFVKDQNSDNGEYKAQTTYDRIRAEMEEQYMAAERALAKKKAAKKQLQGTLDDYKEEVAAAKEKKPDDMDELQSIHEEKKRVEAKKAQKAEVAKPSDDDTCWWPWSMWCCGWWPWSCPAETSDATEDKFEDVHREMATDITAGTRQVEEAVQRLQKCEKEFAAKKAVLKRHLAVLERLKMEKEAADAKVQQARAAESEAETQVAILKEKLAEQVAEYEAANAAYLKQKALVDKMSALLDEKAKKVEAMRAAEDKSGGVYYVNNDVARPPQRSSARSTHACLMVAAAMTTMMFN